MSSIDENSSGTLRDVILKMEITPIVLQPNSSCNNDERPRENSLNSHLFQFLVTKNNFLALSSNRFNRLEQESLIKDMMTMMSCMSITDIHKLVEIINATHEEMLISHAYSIFLSILCLQVLEDPDLAEKILIKLIDIVVKMKENANKAVWEHYIGIFSFYYCPINLIHQKFQQLINFAETHITHNLVIPPQLHQQYIILLIYTTLLCISPRIRQFLIALSPPNPIQPIRNLISSSLRSIIRLSSLSYYLRWMYSLLQQCPFLLEYYIELGGLDIIIAYLTMISSQSLACQTQCIQFILSLTQWNDSSLVDSLQTIPMVSTLVTYVIVMMNEILTIQSQSQQSSSSQSQSSQVVERYELLLLTMTILSKLLTNTNINTSDNNSNNATLQSIQLHLLTVIDMRYYQYPSYLHMLSTYLPSLFPLKCISFLLSTPSSTNNTTNKQGIMQRKLCIEVLTMLIGYYDKIKKKQYPLSTTNTIANTTNDTNGHYGGHRYALGYLFDSIEHILTPSIVPFVIQWLHSFQYLLPTTNTTTNTTRSILEQWNIQIINKICHFLITIFHWKDTPFPTNNSNSNNTNNNHSHNDGRLWKICLEEDNHSHGNYLINCFPRICGLIAFAYPPSTSTSTSTNTPPVVLLSISFYHFYAYYLLSTTNTTTNTISISTSQLFVLHQEQLTSSSSSSSSSSSDTHFTKLIIGLCYYIEEEEVMILWLQVILSWTKSSSSHVIMLAEILFPFFQEIIRYYRYTTTNTTTTTTTDIVANNTTTTTNTNTNTILLSKSKKTCLFILSLTYQCIHNIVTLLTSPTTDTNSNTNTNTLLIRLYSTVLFIQSAFAFLIYHIYTLSSLLPTSTTTNNSTKDLLENPYFVMEWNVLMSIISLVIHWMKLDHELVSCINNNIVIDKNTIIYHGQMKSLILTQCQGIRIVERLVRAYRNLIVMTNTNNSNSNNNTTNTNNSNNNTNQYKELLHLLLKILRILTTAATATNNNNNVVTREKEEEVAEVIVIDDDSSDSSSDELVSIGDLELPSITITSTDNDVNVNDDENNDEMSLQSIPEEEEVKVNDNGKDKDSNSSSSISDSSSSDEDDRDGTYHHPVNHHNKQQQSLLEEVHSTTNTVVVPVVEKEEEKEENNSFIIVDTTAAAINNIQNNHLIVNNANNDDEEEEGYWDVNEYYYKFL